MRGRSTRRGSKSCVVVRRSAYEKSKSPAKGTEPAKEIWKQVAPAVKDIDGTKVDALLTALTNARATSFVDKSAATGLEYTGGRA